MPPKKAEAAPADDEALAEPAEPEPPNEDEETVLATGLELPLRGVDVARIWALQGNCSAQIALLDELLSLPSLWPSLPQRRIVNELFLFNLIQAKAICLSPRQGAVFHAIMSRVLDAIKCPGVDPKTKPSEMPTSQSDCFQEFQTLIMQHSIDAPPDKLCVFRLTEAKMLIDFASTTFFKHFLLYMFGVNFEQDVQTLRVRRGVPRPLPPPDLALARARPRRKEQEAPAASGAGGAGEAGAREGGGDDAGSGVGEEMTAEEEELHRLVEEKLRATEAVLQAKLEAREEAFRKKLADKKGKK